MQWDHQGTIDWNAQRRSAKGLYLFNYDWKGIPAPHTSGLAWYARAV
jgi:hypothetical protein